jgi:hypothetical protein
MHAELITEDAKRKRDEFRMTACLPLGIGASVLTYYWAQHCHKRPPFSQAKPPNNQTMF